MKLLPMKPQPPVTNKLTEESSSELEVQDNNSFSLDKGRLVKSLSKVLR